MPKYNDFELDIQNVKNVENEQVNSAARFLVAEDKARALAVPSVYRQTCDIEL